MKYIFFLSLSCFLNSQILFGQVSTSKQRDTTMILVKGGNTQIGSAEGLDDEKPVFQTFIRPFLIDKDLVTVGQFRVFVRLTRYVTDAEKKGKAMVYDSVNQKWEAKRGANWLFPSGDAKKPSLANEAVRQISWNDAKAYCTWVNKRLPTEFELELIHREAKNIELNFHKNILWQWSDSWYLRYDDVTYYKKNLNRQKVLKGGIIEKESTARYAARLAASPEYAYSYFGFRCAKDLD